MIKLIINVLKSNRVLKVKRRIRATENEGSDVHLFHVNYLTSGWHLFLSGCFQNTFFSSPQIEYSSVHVLYAVCCMFPSVEYNFKFH